MLHQRGNIKAWRGTVPITEHEKQARLDTLKKQQTAQEESLAHVTFLSAEVSSSRVSTKS